MAETLWRGKVYEQLLSLVIARPRFALAVLISSPAGKASRYSHSDLELAEEAMRLQPTDFVHKPMDRGALEAALKKAAARIRALGP